MRVMKDRKHLTHSELVNEVTRQLASRYCPDPHELKKRIEELIEVWAATSPFFCVLLMGTFAL